MKKVEIILTIGVPASGKSTWAKDFVKYKSEKHVRVCRDDYRMMLSQAQQLDRKGENLVTELVNSAIAAAANARYNVIVDATNLNLKYLEPTIDFCQKYGDVKFRLFDISLEKAKERDKAREASVGDVVMDKMWKQFRAIIDGGYDIYSTRPKKDRMEETKFISASNRTDCVVFDLDGTLAHNNGKRGYFDWLKVGVDDVDEVTKETLVAYKNRGYEIVIVSGRDGVSMKPTIKWLDDNDIPFDNIFLRPEGDYRKDTLIKTEIFENNLKPNYNILCVLEDRKKVVDMWRGLGVKCFQVVDGDY
jgi:predicted kinase